MDELLNKDLIVICGSIQQRVAQSLPISSLGNTNRRAGARGFDEHRIAKAVFQQLQNSFHMVAQFTAAHKLPCSLRDTRLICHQLGQGLVHSHSGGGHMGANIRNARKLQQTLHSAVLTILTVENREHHIDPLPDDTVTLKAQQALTPDRRNSCPAVIGMVAPLAGRQLGIIRTAIENPIALPGDTHGEDIVLFLIHIVQHRFSGPQRNIMLRASAAEQNANA